MSRATDVMLDALHEAQATELLAQFKKYKNSEDGIIPPALFAQINKFLKDNGVDRAASPGDSIDLLADEVPDFDNVVEGDFKCQQ
ncbi:MAG: hypothetical protein ACXABN_19450 [Candidatus Thorarchaeota archaeon]|jgi:hypothetical protein